MEVYLKELTHLAEEVQEARVALDDGELTLIALNGLNASYDAFVTAQTAREDDITFAAFQGLLQAHDERYSHSSSTIVMPMANAASSEVVVYQICQKKGHSAISCYNRHNENRFPRVIDKKSRYQPLSGLKASSAANAI